MSQIKLTNTNITGSVDLISPAEIKKLLPLTSQAEQVVSRGRRVIQDILEGRDKRLLFVVGPCSIHDTKAAMEYAARLKKLSEQVQEKIFMVMRVYFEKPRTTVGWKGFINDPFLDDSFHLEEGIKIARSLLLDIAEMGLPTATEALDPIIPQYISELISWSAIGARTTESQTHREMASGLSMPVGIKNGTDGGFEIALNALKAVKNPHHFLGISQEGRIAKFSTRGNPYAHMVLRGGGGQSNYHEESIRQCVLELQKQGLCQKVMIDCSHENSFKDHTRQKQVLEDCLAQIKNGNTAIMGFMIESHLFSGNQALPKDLAQLKYGVSITDKCVGWEETEAMVKGVFKWA